MPDGRILIAEKAGIVKVVKGGVLQSGAVLDIRARVNDYGDRGLLGLAADPNFASNGFVYLLYSYEHDAGNPSGGKTSRVTRVTMTGDTASAASEVVLVGKTAGSGCNNFPKGTDCIPVEANHMGGNIRFASDGSMFVTTGDGATSSTVNNNALRAQDLDLLAGKVLRIDPSSGAGLPSNPFWSGDATANRSKVWAYGLRNPFRINLRPGSDVPFIGDVGWHDWEEINVGASGANYGWPCYEGTARQSGYEPKAVCQALYSQGSSAVRFPLHKYSHNGGHASVTGGTFYTGTSFPAEYRGAYVYGDYSLNWVRSLRVDANNALVAGSDASFATGADGPVDIEMGPDGNLYYVAIATGQLRRIHFTAATQNRPPAAVASATPTNGLAPLTVQFSATGSSDPDDDPLQYGWDFGDGTNSSEASPEHTYDANGTYTATLTVSDGRGGSSTDTVTITVGNRAPTATISAPTSSLRYGVGDTIAYSGAASDPDEGDLADSALSWTITIRHCPGGACHTHQFLTSTGSGGTFTVPDHGDDTHFEIALTATDSGGLTDKTTVAIQPKTVRITLATEPTGLQVVYDGTAGAAPLTRTTIVGSTHTIHAPSPQNGATFASWSDVGAQQHEVTVGGSDVSYTATFDAPLFRVWAVTPADGATVAGAVRWEADSSGAPIAKIEFSIDGVLRWTERESPYVFNGNTGTWDTTKEASGSHTLGLRAVATDGGVALSSITVTVANNGTQTVTAYPTQTTVSTGKLRAGDASRLAADDNVYYQVNSTSSGTRTAAWYGSFTDVPKELTSLKATYKGKNSRSCSQSLSIWRWTDSTWVQFDSRSVGTSEISIAKTPGGTLANYVRGTGGPGELRVRVRCRASAGFYTSGDLLKIVYAASA